MKLYLTIIVLLLLVPFAFADEDSHNVEAGLTIIKSQVPCDQLSNEELEQVGEYYMEQMHPGEAHEVMDQMMGGEGSASLRQAHINMAYRFYCNQYDGSFQGGMMGMMNTPQQTFSNQNVGSFGMMNGMGSFGLGYGFGFLFNLIVWGIVIFIIVWIILKFKQHDKDPITIAKERYARSEISKKEFEQIKKDLK